MTARSEVDRIERQLAAAVERARLLSDAGQLRRRSPAQLDRVGRTYVDPAIAPFVYGS